MKLNEDRELRYRAFISGVITSQVVYNADWKEAKDMLNRLIDSEIDKVTRPHHTTNYSDIYYSHPYANQLMGFLKKILKARDRNQTDPYLSELEDVVRELMKLSEPLLALKPQLKSGCKPQERKTPARTLENTGTCGICRMNVKIEGTGLYHHRFTVQWGQRNGSCFGRGYPPIEVSSDVLVDYLGRVLKPAKKAIETKLATYKSPEVTTLTVTSHFRTVRENGRHIPLRARVTDAIFGQIVTEEIRYAEEELRSITREIEIREQELREWKPGKLPS